MDWKTIALKKRQEQTEALRPYLAPEDKLPSEEVRKDNEKFIKFLDQSDLLTDEEKAITNIPDVVSLLAKIKSKDLTCDQVIRAYIKRATLAHQLTNCLTEINFDHALKRAKELDQHIESGRELLPLHGLPISVKDQFDIQGLDTTMGYVAKVGEPKTHNAALVDMLEKLGAIVFVKTNLPLSIMTSESDNYLWGRTNNPYNKDLTAGGSTGGESALLASKGSILGWGTDLTGSVRIPQAMCGGYSLRPTHHRFPYRRVSVTSDGQEHIPSVIGPMSRTFSTLLFMTRTVIEENPWKYDHLCVPMEWNQSAFDIASKSKLRIGVQYFNGIVRPHPPVERLLNEAVKKLEAAGHEIIRFETGLDEKAYNLLESYYYVDGAQELRRELQRLGEPMTDQVSEMVRDAKPRSVLQYWEMNLEKRKIQQTFFDKWNATKDVTSNGEPIDVILNPALATSAVPHNQTHDITYTELYSALNYPCAVFPVGKVDKAIDVKDESYVPVNDRDERVWKKYDPELMHGLPINLQLAARSYNEEKLLGSLLNVLNSLDINPSKEFGA
uniref:ARAD1B18106p n=1 Tax=Blastobotrys adeninivorans TaxID=409370 RepID=A0A060T6C8_BLAAD